MRTMPQPANTTATEPLIQKTFLPEGRLAKRCWPQIWSQHQQTKLSPSNESCISPLLPRLGPWVYWPVWPIFLGNSDATSFHCFLGAVATIITREVIVTRLAFIHLTL